MSITGKGGDLTSQWKKSEKSEMLSSWHFFSQSLNISNCRFDVKGLFFLVRVCYIPFHRQ